ncbi:hypothetical protein BGZ95_002738 [Linnemannia exigua]|uniref:Uncharacterized protein n=1 Tax=Linnemannia exigua TaxID=604196 RepID=A0AAD4D5I3_9FUNG|nr:hypothetical protein BGZ95_002738 [Linnemannia exigua]
MTRPTGQAKKSQRHHRSRLTSPSARSRTGSRGGLKREFPDDEDFDMDLVEMPSRRVHMPNENPTPSELLSMDLTTLALHNRNSANSSSSGLQSALATPSPSARFRDDAAVERFNLSLPFDRIAGPNFTSTSSASSSSSTSASSPSPFRSNHHSNNNHYNSGSLESVHRYPTRTAASQNDSSPFTTPVKTNSNNSSGNRSTPTAPSSAASSSSPSIFASRSALQSPPRSSPRQFMNDEDNNLFLTQSPRAIRTPRKPMSQLDNNTNINILSPAERSTSTISSSTAQASSSSSADYSASTSTNHLYNQPVPTPAALMTPGASQTMTDFNDDDMTDTESVLSSQGDGEKENVTPKMSEDPSNPFFVSSESKRTVRYTKTDGSTTPTGCTTAPGTIRRSRRLALGSISPWRWNSFDEYGNLLYTSLGAGGLKGKGVDWIEGKQSKGVPATAGAGCGGESSAGSSSGSSSGVGPSSASRVSMIGPPLSGKATKQLPDNHPNAPDSNDKKGVPSRTAMRNAESVIEPQSVAFNRRAQKVAGSIFYWKNGKMQLFSESDKQQWPGEWKFEVYQDPESPGAPSAPEEVDHFSSTTNNSSASTSSSSATYYGKGKLTDRQLSGPSSKRMRISGGSESSQQPISTSPHPSESELSGAGISDAQDFAPPASPTPSLTINNNNTSGSNSPQAPKLMGSRPSTPSKKVRMQDRYDFRERRMINEPLTPRSRRCGA